MRETPFPSAQKKSGSGAHILAQPGLHLVSSTHSTPFRNGRFCTLTPRRFTSCGPFLQAISVLRAMFALAYLACVFWRGIRFSSTDYLSPQEKNPSLSPADKKNITVNCIMLAQEEEGKKTPETILANSSVARKHVALGVGIGELVLNKLDHNERPLLVAPSLSSVLPSSSFSFRSGHHQSFGDSRSTLSMAAASISISIVFTVFPILAASAAANSVFGTVERVRSSMTHSLRGPYFNDVHKIVGFFYPLKFGTDMQYRNHATSLTTSALPPLPLPVRTSFK